MSRFTIAFMKYVVACSSRRKTKPKLTNFLNLGSFFRWYWSPNVIHSGGHQRYSFRTWRHNRSVGHDGSYFDGRAACRLDSPSGHVAVGPFRPTPNGGEGDLEEHIRTVPQLPFGHHGPFSGCWGGRVAVHIAQTELSASALLCLLATWRAAVSGSGALHRVVLHVRHHRWRSSTSIELGHVGFAEATDDCRARSLPSSKGIWCLVINYYSTVKINSLLPIISK